MSRRRLEEDRRSGARVGAVARWVLGGVAIVFVAVGLALGGPAIGTAVAGDQLAVVDPVPHQVEVEPGEVFEVDVVVRSWGGHGSAGVENVTLRAQYHPDHLEVTDVDAGTWFGADADVETEVTVANDRGVTEVRQYEEPPAGGATGEDVFATLTVRVAEDAPPSNATIDLDETSAELADDQPLPILERPVTVVIDGGGEPRESSDYGELDDLEGEASADRTDEPLETDDDPIPAFTAVAGGIAVVALLVGAAVAGHRFARR
ncbi:cohesin domain-containing protein [Natronobeatus ordinarius]|uniref:cohesin domain-containing protein n=1 Tax=Natronobeatus ordinarius TaxID=2963433 RepID=UPI0020CF6702|nr:cohesin domain-containing protein [Natronobeatus ordinarius]